LFLLASFLIKKLILLTSTHTLFLQVKNAHRVEVTTNLKGTTIRSTEESPDMYASIDAVSDRIVSQLLVVVICRK
jgi:putative sigma-54 modulation protein